MLMTLIKYDRKAEALHGSDVITGGYTTSRGRQEINKVTYPFTFLFTYLLSIFPGVLR